MSSNETAQVRIATVAANDEQAQSLASFFAGHKVIHLPMDLEKLIAPIPELAEGSPHILVSGAAPTSGDGLELAQVLRMTNPGARIFYVCAQRDGFDRKNLIGNGFTDAFLLPVDHETFVNAVKEALSDASHGAIKTYRPVKLVDLQPDTVLAFDTSIFLPVNNKYIKYSASGDPIDGGRVDNLKKHHVNTVFIDKSDLSKFYQYTADKLKSLASSQTMSATERTDRLQGAVRELMSGIFNDTTKDVSFEHGRSVMQDCQEIVKTYILQTPSGQWYKKLLEITSEGETAYSHATSVSAYCALFSMALGIGDPEEMAMAGMLHDIGLADVPLAIQVVPEEKRTPENASIYRRHPEMSLEIMNRKRLLLPPPVSKAILQHHERYNGSGYPRGISESRIAPEATILALADRFDYLTSVKEGKPMTRPLEVLKLFKKEIEGNPKDFLYDPEIVRSLLNLFGVT